MKRRTVSDVLEAAAELISTPDAWTTGCMARDRDGRSVPALSRSAVSFCAMGAIRRASGRSEIIYSGSVDALRRTIQRPVTAWNDGYGMTAGLVVSELRAAAKASR